MKKAILNIIFIFWAASKQYVRGRPPERSSNHCPLRTGSMNDTTWCLLFSLEALRVTKKAHEGRPPPHNAIITTSQRAVLRYCICGKLFICKLQKILNRIKSCKIFFSFYFFSFINKLCNWINNAVPRFGGLWADFETDHRHLFLLCKCSKTNIYIF